MPRASYFIKKDAGSVQCLLCPHNCIIKPDRFGICNVRRNRDGVLYSENYGVLSSIAVDPIEKKPLYHFYPGSRIMSIGGYGCNLICSFCQNCSISQVEFQDYAGSRVYRSEEVVKQAIRETDNLGIAFTYNEPTVFFEFMMDCAELAAENNLKNVVVTNGFINEEPLRQLIAVTDAFNIDVKSFSDDFYRRITGSALQPVLHAVEQVAESGKHLELTYLIIPGLNDKPENFVELVKWINNNCGKSTVLHISRYYPHYKLQLPPTPIETISEYVSLASEYLDFVYPGNVGTQLSSDTRCPVCHEKVIARSYYNTTIVNLDESGSCRKCNTKISVTL